MKKIIVNNKIITTSLFLKNLVELNNKGKYKSICLFFGDSYENPTLLKPTKKRGYNKQNI